MAPAAIWLVWVVSQQAGADRCRRRPALDIAESPTENTNTIASTWTGQAASKHCTRLRDTAIQEPDRDRASCCSAPARPPFDEGREALAPWRKRQRAHQAAKADRSGLRGRPHSAPGDMSKAHLTQAWLAVSDDPLARSSGEYFYHQQLREPNPIARDVTMHGISCCPNARAFPVLRYPSEGALLPLSCSIGFAWPSPIGPNGRAIFQRSALSRVIEAP